LRHQASHKRDVAGQAIELGHNYAAFRGLGCCQGSRELRPAIEGIGAFAGFRLDELGDDREGLRFRKPLNGRALSI
jgi:hypothetical protein